MHRRFSFTNDELAVAEGSNPALPDARRPIGIFGVLDEEIWTINADGTRPTRLTNNISNQNTPPALANSVFVMNLDGTAIQQITEPVGTSHDVYPNYSPDGSKIVFASDRMSSDGSSLDIFTINADGSSLTRIATGVTVGACADLIALPRPGAANHDGPKRAKFDRLTEASAMS
jgi:hypothetical protein